MKSLIAVVLCLASLALPAAWSRPAYEQRVKDVRAPLDARSAPYTEVIDVLEKLRAEPEFATNAAARAYVDQQLVALCFVPYHPWLKRWRPSLEERVPGMAERSVKDAEVPYAQRADLAISLAKYHADGDRYAEAEKVLRGLPPPPPKTNSKVAVKIPLAIARLRLWQDRFDDAWKAVETEAAPVDPVEAAKFATEIPCGDADGARVKALWLKSKDPLPLFSFYREDDPKCPAYVREMAFAYVTNAANRLDFRGSVALARFAADDSPRSVAARRSLRGQDFTKVWYSWHLAKPVENAYRNGRWDLVIELLDLFGTVKVARRPDLRRMRAVALANTGRTEEALAVARSEAAREDEDLTAVDRALAQCLVKILETGDCAAALEGAKLERKDRTETLKALVPLAFSLGRSDLAEQVVARYEKTLVDYPQREQKVAFSKEPVTSINDWRRIRKDLDSQVIDRPFGARLDILDTDVATGRELVEKTERDSKDVKMEISSVCDTFGLHVFLRVEDANARAVENGFAGGVGTEMYFAPGLGEPYACFGSHPRTGVRGAFQTAYDSKTHKRVDFTGREDRDAFRSEVQFTDSDYVQHLFFAWDTMAAKLPSKDRPWRFECISFTPAGPFSWGGSEGVHNASLWGNLVFDFRPEEIAAIRRAIIYRTVKKWRKPGLVDIFGRWADDEVGDPAFYTEVLKPLEAELAGYEAEVTSDMDDATVNRIYAAAIPRWKGLRDEIDELRRNWLLDRQLR